MKDYREDNERFDKDNCSEESSCEERMYKAIWYK